MKILLLGSTSGTNVVGSVFRCLNKNKVEVFNIDPNRYFYKFDPIRKFFWSFCDKKNPYQNAFFQCALNWAKQNKGIIFFTGVNVLYPENIKHLRQFSKIVCFLTDDPWNYNVASKWCINGFKYVHKVFTPRLSNIEDLKNIGCLDVRYLPFGFDCKFLEFNNLLCPLEEYDLNFIGGCDIDRLAIIKCLVDFGFNIKLFGDYWSKNSFLKNYSFGHANFIQICEETRKAKVNLILARRANRDGHVMRTFEAAALGGCLLVEDTMEHRAIFGNNFECVVFFKDLKELISNLKTLLKYPDLRKKLRINVRSKIVENNSNSYDARCQVFFPELFA